MNKLSERKSTNSRKLTLNKETIVELSEIQFYHVVRGAGSGPGCRSGSLLTDCTSVSAATC
jgi:hypothetical protein